MSGVLIDTCMWSLALRGKEPKECDVAQQLTQLIDENRAKIIGPIRQEVLSGYSDRTHYERLRAKLQYFPNESIADADYEAAAEYSNFCRAKGVQGSHIDFLICAVAVRLTLSIYTNDKDFLNYQKHLPISLFDLA
jgi:predicted nucleic acid-binding protein